MRKLKAFFKNNIYWNLFFCFFKIGMFTIGGGMAMIPILEEKICDKYGWMSSEEVLDCIAVSQSLPGVIAVNMATYVGYKKKGRHRSSYNYFRGRITFVCYHHSGGIFS